MDEKSTLGLRIQECRRTAGLSQEALGQRLNVSRQAVSKWEADAAIPELENLIAMSRIFGVSIGRLLGVEPEQTETAGPAERPPEDGRLTEKELAAVEAIAAKYAEEAQRHQRPGWSRKRKAITCALAAAAVLAAVLLVKGQLEAIYRRLSSMEAQVYRVQTALDQQVSALSGELSNILEENSSIISDSQAAIIDFDPNAQTVTLLVSAVPKELTDTTTAVFTATLADGRQFTAVGERRSGCFASESLVVPMDDQTIRLSVALTDGGSTRIGAMEPLYDCHPDFFRLHVEANCSSSITENSNPWSEAPAHIDFGDLHVEIWLDAPVIRQALAPTAVDFCLYRNQEITPVWSTPVPEAVSDFQQNGYADISAVPPGEAPSYTPEPGETVVAALRVTDTMGTTTWTVLDVFRASSSRSISRLHWSNLEPWSPGTAIP